MADTEPGTAFLAKVADPARPVIAERVVLVFAHPDDETLACGALLPRLQSPTVVHLTDGAPRNGEDASRLGYADPRAYAAVRRQELQAAMELAGVGKDRLICLDVPDQGAASVLAKTARRLLSILATADVVITHALEGGHPDHDAACFAVQAAAKLLSSRRREGPGSRREPLSPPVQGTVRAGLEEAPALIEVPLYRLGPEGGWLRQSFGGGALPSVLQLTEGERELKRRMIDAHRTQRETLLPFGAADEPYRAAPSYDFARLPNGGSLLYERYGWGLTGRCWLELAAEAARELGQDRGP